MIPNRLESIRKLIGKLGPAGTLKACYEGGPTGYVLYSVRDVCNRSACPVVCLFSDALDLVESRHKPAVSGICGLTLIFGWARG